MSAGYEGLAQAARAFDPGRKVRFSTFARARIKGAMLDDMRSRDLIGRRERWQAKSIQAAADQLSAELRRPPTAGEISVETGLAEDKVREIGGHLHLVDVIWMDEHPESDGWVPADDDEPLGPLLQREAHAALVEAVDCLPTSLRRVVLAVYVDGQSYFDVAQELGVSESRICQLVGRALSLLSEVLDHGSRPPVQKDKQGRRYVAKMAERFAAADPRARLEPEAASLEWLVTTP